MSDRYAKYHKMKFDYPADRVLRITFDRPETFNSVDSEMHTQMTDMWIDIDRDPDINAVIVTGAGKAFSAGGDFSLIEKMIGDSHEIMKTWKEAKDLVYNIINCNKPIISAINGPAAGAGLEEDFNPVRAQAGLSARRVDIAAVDDAVLLVEDLQIVGADIERPIAGRGQGAGLGQGRDRSEHETGTGQGSCKSNLFHSPFSVSAPPADSST